MSNYLIINILVICIPLLLSFDKKVHFYKRWKFFLPALMITAILFVVWDILFTFWGVWGFNEMHLSGIHFLGLPVEEILFFVSVPYASIFTYDVLNIYFPIKNKPNTTKWLSRFIALVLLVLGIVFINRIYTSVTFLTTAVFLLAVVEIMKPQWMWSFYRAFSVTVIPFFIVNGVLTGLHWNIPVVWYNDAQNLGIRMLSIPVEDLVYGFLLLFVNVTLYELFKVNFSSRKSL